MIKQMHFPCLNDCFSILTACLLWSILTLMGVVAVLGPSRVWSAEPEPGSEIVARVNGAPVTRGELRRAMADPLIQHHFEWEPGNEKSDSEEMERLALNKLIERRLILEEARRRNFTVTENEIDKTLVALRRRFKELKDFGVWMKEQGLDDKTLFDTIRADMLTKRVMAALVQGVSLTDKEVKAYYEAYKEDLKTEEVWIQIIVVKDRATAEEIQTALGKGEDFGRLARQRSVGKRAARGGDAGWVDAETLWPPMREAVSSLKPGEAIGPLQRGEEFLIVRLHGRRPGRTESLEQARSEIERRLLLAKQQEVIQTWLKEQEEKSKIEVLLKPEYSDSRERVE